MKKLLIATTNPGKLDEIRYFLKDLPLKLLSLADLKIKETPIEDGTTFEENAIKKAKFYFKKTKLPVIADDGGLEIDYFNREPGVKSRRWIGGKGASDKKLINYTLQKMKGLPLEKRRAQLRTVLALALPNGKIITQEGKIGGIVANKVGAITKGYPYRSLFFLPKISKYYDHKTLTKEEYEKYSHRGQALKKLKKVIKKWILCYHCI